MWVENIIASSVILTDLLIKEKARFFANAFNIQEDELVFSNGWLDRFKKEIIFIDIAYMKNQEVH